MRALLALALQMSAAAQGPITVDYPEMGSIFPPDMAAPTFLWRDPVPGVAEWLIDVEFGSGSAALHLRSRGERLRINEIDARCLAPTNEFPKLTPQQAEAHTWKPDADTWAAIKQQSVDHPATITLTGLEAGKPVSRGQVVIQTSKDPVAAPIFYRDVPLMPSELEKGVIKPLAQEAIPMIAWRLKNVAESGSRLLLTGLHTCANCHSFSRDGKTLAMDMDGPRNDKGMYAIVPIKPNMTIRSEDVVTWSTFRKKLGGQVRVGFMSQISPDGQYVVTTIGPEADRPKPPPLRNNYYVANFKDYRFLQVFYPTRGILAWYSRAAGHLQPLPGADDSRYVHTAAVWSPDGKYLVFARAEAKEAYPAGGKPAEYANDPNETAIRYDLYRIPFNEGRGGRPEPVPGASRNGMSNSFPKVSPDGRWIVFVQCRNGQLMRPDSQLYIIPAQGGEARRLRSNTPLMNSWHSFSPNGRWLVFSSKSRSPYTQMFLTHLDEEGRDSPAILIENATAANRAVNIPEFVNIPPDGLLKIDAPVTEFYRLFDSAFELAQAGRYEAAIAEWNKALALSPDEAMAHENLGLALAKVKRFDEAIAHYQRVLQIDPNYPGVHNNLGVALASQGKLEQAIAHLEKALDADPDSPDIHNSLGAALVSKRELDKAIPHFEKALESNPGFAEAHYSLGTALASKGSLEEAAAHLKKVVELRPGDARAGNYLGMILAKLGKLEEAIAQYQKALETGPGNANVHYNLGVALIGKGRQDEAVAHFEKALAINPELVQARNTLGDYHYLHGRIADALAHWRQVLQAEPNHLPVLNQMAWVLATSPDASIRNGAEAVRFAEKAAQLARGEQPAILDSLAAAYAEVGRFEEAAEVSRRALTLATQQNQGPLAEALKVRLALYEARTPFRDTRRQAQ